MNRRSFIKKAVAGVCTVAMVGCMGAGLVGCNNGGSGDANNAASTDITSKLVKCENVGAVATAVAGGDAQAGIVYSSDLIKYADQGLVQCADITDKADPIAYPGAVMTFKDTKTEQATEFLDWLTNNTAAQAIFQDYGFYTVSEKATSETPKSDDAKVSLTIFAANSTSDALAKAEELYKETHPNYTFTNNTQASGKLVEAMKGGETCDIFISASKSTMTDAVDAKYTDEKNVTQMYTNNLVIVSNNENSSKVKSIEDLANLDTIAIGEPESVPAGKYAMQALQAAGLVPAAS